jgi:TadE-like protein
MVILLPLFLVLVFGMIEFGRVFNYWIDLTHLANEGARYASVNRWPGCPSNYDVDACSPDATLQPYLVERANTGELKAQLDDPGGVEICYPLGGTADVGEPIRVVVSADVELPVLGSLLAAIGMPDTIAMSASSTQRMEWIPDRFDETSEGWVASCP